MSELDGKTILITGASSGIGAAIASEFAKKNVNVAIGGNWGGKEGIANDIFPNSMEIDYVRIYDLK